MRIMISVNEKSDVMFFFPVDEKHGDKERERGGGGRER